MLSCLSLETSQEMLCAGLMPTGGKGPLSVAQFSHSHRKQQPGGLKRGLLAIRLCQGF